MIFDATIFRDFRVFTQPLPQAVADSKMTETFALTDVEGELVATLEQLDARPSDDVPFRVLLIGDWSGRRNRGLSASSEELSAWRPLLVDRDNLDHLIARLGVKLHLPLTSDGSQSLDRKSTRLNSSHSQISYAVFCLKKKKNYNNVLHSSSSSHFPSSKALDISRYRVQCTRPTP